MFPIYPSIVVHLHQGGLKAVVWTDAIQSAVMYGTILTICIKGTLDLGGLSVVLERNWQGGRLRLPECVNQIKIMPML